MSSCILDLPTWAISISQPEFGSAQGQIVPHEIVHRRGRTPERGLNSSTYSRDSSASSTSTLINERMEWANEERSRSASRPAPEPASPFTESSPYHQHRRMSQIPALGTWDARDRPLVWSNVATPGPYTCDVPQCTAGTFQTQYLLA